VAEEQTPTLLKDVSLCPCCVIVHRICALDTGLVRCITVARGAVSLSWTLTEVAEQGSAGLLRKGNTCEGLQLSCDELLLSNA
jgi:hypothetical protein